MQAVPFVRGVLDATAGGLLRDRVPEPDSELARSVRVRVAAWRVGPLERPPADLVGPGPLRQRYRFGPLYEHPTDVPGATEQDDQQKAHDPGPHPPPHSSSLSSLPGPNGLRPTRAAACVGRNPDCSANG